MFLRSRNRFELGASDRPLSDAPKAKLSVMSMLRKLLSPFDLPPAPPASTDVDRERLARDVVAERSHGSVLLQKKMYYTKEDIEAETQEARRYDFRPREGGRG